MKGQVLIAVLFGLSLAGTVCGGEPAVERSSADAADVEAAARRFTEGIFLEKSTQAEQAAVRAGNPSDFSMELRPAASEDDAGLAFRIYLPTRWSQSKLRERLELAARSEKLRISALEGQTLLAVYRDLAVYRLLQKQIALYAAEMEWLEPFLDRADQGVRNRQLTVQDRARLYGLYLGLLNRRQELELEWIGNQRVLHQAVGTQADLEALARVRPTAVPARVELDGLLRQALENRADYRQLAVEAEALDAAEAMARAEDGLRFKYLQPSYGRDYRDDEDVWAVSAAFVLPWGARNPDIDDYRGQRELTDARMALQRAVMKERLAALLQASAAFREKIDQWIRRVQPLLDRLILDLEQMKTLPLSQVIAQIRIREQILETALQTAGMEHQRDLLAIEFAEEFGTLDP